MSATPPPARTRKAIVERKDGRRLRRTTIYFEPDLARRLALYAAEHDLDLSAAVSAFCEAGLRNE